MSRKKSHSNVNNGRSELSLFQSGRTFMSGRENVENQKQLHMPGYTGHVPKATNTGNQGDSMRTDKSNPADKSLLAENYRHNVVGYTGHVK